MCWIFKKARMLHLPRTAGHWIIGASRNAGMEVYQWGQKHSFPDESCGENMPTFCVIRDPVDWYKSYFGYKNTPGANWGAKFSPWSNLDKKCWAGEINTFVENVCDWSPGFYSKMVKKYVVEGVRVCRFSRMEDDVVEALAWSGEEFSERKFRRTKKLNAKAKYNKNKCSGANRHFMEMSEDTIKMIHSFESDYYERYGDDF